ncbi:uncharacterized protein A4U43_C03F950 [Asparagus officinalis]|uniref:Uncharacterized protein n=1 Tax=Asparagus officinalis TaxID=4686 RepID=A0A5P1FBA5_ASPOF|nr:uncharacterized protein LOC109832613 [Asparagus officinalis]ONK73921.1 uncharacterized protein A4U43_C03F950 [Asparagus officinalis]
MGDSETETGTQIEGVESSKDSWKSDSEDMDYSDDSWKPNSDYEAYSSDETNPDVILADRENLEYSDIEMNVSSVDENNKNCFAYNLDEYDDLDDWCTYDFDPNLGSVGISGGGLCANMTSDDAKKMKNMKLEEDNTEESEPIEIKQSDTSESRTSSK